METHTSDWEVRQHRQVLLHSWHTEHREVSRHLEMLSHAMKWKAHRGRAATLPPNSLHSAITYPLSLQWMKIIHVWYMQPPWWSLFHQLSWPSWSRTMESITITMEGMMGEGWGGVFGVKSVLSHEDWDFWRPRELWERFVKYCICT